MPVSAFQNCIDQFLDVFSDGVCVTDEHGVVLFVNATHSEFTGVPRRHMVGHNVSEFTGQGIFDIVLNPEVFRTGKVVTRVQTLADGHRLVLEGHPIFDGEHRVIFCVTLLRDESRLQDLQGTVAFQKELLEVFSKLSNSPKEFFGQMPEIVESSAMAASVCLYCSASPLFFLSCFILFLSKSISYSKSVSSKNIPSIALILINASSEHMGSIPKATL